MAGSSPPTASSSAWPTLAVARKKASVGTPVSSRQLVPDERVVADGLAADRQLGLRARAAEALAQRCPLALDLEVELDRGWLGRAPGPGLADILAVGVGLAEERQLDRLLDGRLAGLVGTAHDGQPGGRLDLQLLVGLEVGESQAGDAHG